MTQWIVDAPNGQVLRNLRAELRAKAYDY